MPPPPPNSTLFPYTTLFRSRLDTERHRQYPTPSQRELYSVPATGGRVDQVFTVPAEYARVSRDGKKILYHDKKGGENEWRKHQRSAITREIWQIGRASCRER